MGVGGQIHAPVALPPGNRPGTHCMGGWVGPRDGLDWCGKSRPHRDSILGPSSRPLTICLNLVKQKSEMIVFFYILA
jgi:hypothetical protein